MVSSLPQFPPTIPSAQVGDAARGLPPVPAGPSPGATAPETFSKWMPSCLSDNPYFSAGMGLFGLGLGASIIRGSLMRLGHLAERRLLTTLEIPSKDRSYQWVMQWLVARSTAARHLAVETTFAQDSSGHITTQFHFIPSPGRHWMRYNRTWILVERQREKAMVNLQAGLPFETLKLTVPAIQRSVLDALLQDARDNVLRREEGHTILYHSVGQEWRPFGRPKKRRPFDSVILPHNTATQLKKDVEHFLAADQWYFQRGIPYRRGYLLYGPPGCGKTSFVMALAGELEYNVCIMNVSDPFLTDDRLHYLLATVPPRSMVLLEDIDGAITAQEASHAEENYNGGLGNSGDAMQPRDTTGGNPLGVRHHITFSGLLNALDGAVATEERLVFMTTNHIYRLPTSLIRPGRIDVKVFIGWANSLQMKQMFLRFFPDAEEQSVLFVNYLHHLRLSMAELQGLFLLCRESPEEAIKMAKMWATQHTAPETQSSSLEGQHRIDTAIQSEATKTMASSDSQTNSANTTLHTEP